MLNEPVLHHCQMAIRILRVMVVSGPDTDRPSDLKADERVGLDFVKAAALITEAGGNVLRRAPLIRQLYGHAPASPNLGVTGPGRRRRNKRHSACESTECSLDDRCHGGGLWVGAGA